MPITNLENKPPAEKDGLLVKVLKIAAYPLSGFAGWWVARNQIRHYTFMKLKNLGGLEGTPEQGEKSLKEAMGKAVGQIGHDEGSMFELVKETRPIEREYTAAIRTRMKQLGLDNVVKQSEFIYRPQFHKALLEGFTAASIMLGGLLILANSKSLSRAFNDFADRKKDDSSVPR